MTWVPPMGYRTWACAGCGAYANADALAACGVCGAPREGAPAADRPQAAARPRTRTRPAAARKTATKGGR